MDVLFFLQQRTAFIRRLHATSVLPFQETIRKIEGEEPPFVPPYDESGEPPFLEEWLDAGACIQVLSRTCVSMLAATLKLYLQMWENELRLPGRGKGSKESPVVRFQRLAAQAIALDWAACPADLSILEQVVLARNRDQHPTKIGTMTVSHDKHTLEKFPEPFFANPDEMRFLVNPEANGAERFLLDPSLHVSADALVQAIATVEQLAQWLEPQLTRAKYGNPI